MTALALDVRELTPDEVEEVNGAWVANAIGAVVGGIGGGVAGYVTSGGSVRSAIAGAAGGAIVGAISPVRGVLGAANAVRVLHATGVGAAVGAGVEAGVFG